jgi:hypothetical protein
MALTVLSPLIFLAEVLITGIIHWVIRKFRREIAPFPFGMYLRSATAIVLFSYNQV